MAGPTIVISTTPTPWCGSHGDDQIINLQNEMVHTVDAIVWWSEVFVSKYKHMCLRCRICFNYYVQPLCVLKWLIKSCNKFVVILSKQCHCVMNVVSVVWSFNCVVSSYSSTGQLYISQHLITVLTPCLC